MGNIEDLPKSVPAPKGFRISRIQEPLDRSTGVVRYRFGVNLETVVAISEMSEQDQDYRQMTLEYGIEQLSRALKELADEQLK